jgi:hypothetical protein
MTTSKRALPLLTLIALVASTWACPACPDEIFRIPPIATVHDGVLDVSRDATRAVFDVGIIIDGTTHFLRDAPDLESNENRSTRQARMSGTVDDVLVQVTVHSIYSGWKGARVEMTASGDPARLIDGFVLDGTYLSEPLGILSESFASWGLTSFVRVMDGDDVASFELGGLDDQHFTAEPRVSHWLGAARFPEQTVVIGALTAHTWKTRVVTHRASDGRTHVRVVVGGTGAPVALAEGRSSEHIGITADRTAFKAFDAFGQMLAEAHPPLDAPFIPVGWNSWNTFFADISSEKILSAVDAVEELMPDVINTVQIDDGWEVAWGDWTPNERFPDGIAPLAAELSSRGIVPGLWWAPFLVDPSSSTATTHPEWLLRNQHGERISYGAGALGITYHALDLSQPDVQADVLDTLTRILDDGFLYLKLDFLFGGLYEGAHVDPSKTALEHYHALVDEMSRRARERGAYLLACGAPIVPSIGRFHAIRTGDDIAFAGLAYSPAMNKNAFRNVIHRFWSSRAITSDPDTILIRDLPRATQELNIAAALLSGRIVAFGDDFSALDDEGRALLARVSTLPLFEAITDETGEPRFALPLDLFEQASPGVDNKFAHILEPESYAVPAIWQLWMAENVRGIGVFNWWSEPETRTLTTLEYEGLLLSDALIDMFTGETLPVVDGSITIEIPPFGVRLFQVGQ